MATQLVNMKGEEFVRKILAGERDFSRIKLEEGFDLAGYEGFSEMLEYLIKTDLQKSPLILDYSELKGIKAKELYLPFVRGEEAHFEEADLREAYFEGAYFKGAGFGRADLHGANFCGAYLREAYFCRADLHGSYFEGACFLGANFCRADLEMADLRRVKNLEDALYIERANFYNTRVTNKEKAIIKKALKKKQLFVVDEEGLNKN